jgi:NAD(P)-dependent dehydrogenase (short-subunit alcohol dehydrogenase family)
MTDAKPLAVVTGASSGIGFELAKQFAGNGFDLLVTAEDEGLRAAARPRPRHRASPTRFFPGKLKAAAHRQVAEPGRQ